MTSEMPIHLLAQVPYFASLDRVQLHALAGTALRRRYDSGQLILLEGEPCTGLQVVESGWLRSLKTSTTGREQTLRVVGPGEVFSDLTLFAGRPNLVSVVALEPAELWFIPAAAVLRLLDQPSVARLVVQNLALRALQLLSLVEDLSLRTVTARLARLLLENAKEGVVVRRRWSTQAEMASRLGTVPDVLNRALKSLVAEGLIQVDRQQIRICELAALEMKAELDA
jgi:CRP/FNR family transcriptional regulator